MPNTGWHYPFSPVYFLHIRGKDGRACTQGEALQVVVNNIVTTARKMVSSDLQDTEGDIRQDRPRHRLPLSVLE